jgi:hypothetical protein
VAARTEFDMAAARQAHERELLQHRSLAFKARCRWVAVASVLTTGAVAGFAAMLSNDLHDAERTAKDRAAAFAHERDVHRQTATELSDASARLRALETELNRLRAQAMPAEPRPGLPHRLGERHDHEPAVKPSPSRCTGNGDPLDGCLN